MSGFEPHRDHLLAVAYRMLGSRSDAEDAVQEAWVRWHTADRAGIRDERGWLTTVTGRICLDHLRSARVRRESYVGQWLPEPVVERDPDLADQVARTEEISYALLVVLERLHPEQRVAFVLHDVFAVPFETIAEVLATTPAAARQLASRARRAVSGGTPRHTADLTEQRRVLSAFLRAAQAGDIDALVAVLAPDAVAVGDSDGTLPTAPRPIAGALPVARFVAGLLRLYGRKAGRLRVESVRLNGDLGWLAELELPDGRVVRGVTAVAVAGGRVTGVFNQLNPAKLTRLPAPGP